MIFLYKCVLAVAFFSLLQGRSTQAQYHPEIGRNLPKLVQSRPMMVARQKLRLAALFQQNGRSNLEVDFDPPAIADGRERRFHKIEPFAEQHAGLLASNVTSSGFTGAQESGKSDLSYCRSSLIHSAGYVGWLKEELHSLGGWLFLDAHPSSILVGPRKGSPGISISKSPLGAFLEVTCTLPKGLSECNKILLHGEGAEVVLGGFRWSGNAGVFVVSRVEKKSVEQPTTVLRLYVQSLHRPIGGGGRSAAVASERNDGGASVRSFDASTSATLLGPATQSHPIRIDTVKQFARHGRSYAFNASDSARLCRSSVLSVGALGSQDNETSGVSNEQSHTTLVRLFGMRSSTLVVSKQYNTMLRLSGFGWHGNSGVFNLVGVHEIPKSDAAQEDTDGADTCLLLGDPQVITPIRLPFMHGDFEASVHLVPPSGSHEVDDQSEFAAVSLGSATADSLFSSSSKSPHIVSACQGVDLVRGALGASRVGLIQISPAGMDSRSSQPILPLNDMCTSGATSKCGIHIMGLNGNTGAGVILLKRGSVLIVVPGELSQTTTQGTSLASESCGSRDAFWRQLAGSADISQRTLEWLSDCDENVAFDRSVSFVTPSSGVREGGTWVVVEGVTLGKLLRVASSRLRLYFGDQECKLMRILWQSSTHANPWGTVLCISPKAVGPRMVDIIMTTDAAEIANTSASSNFSSDRGASFILGSFEYTSSYSKWTSGDNIGLVEQELGAIVHMKDWKAGDLSGSGASQIVQAAQLQIARERLSQLSEDSARCTSGCSGHGVCGTSETQRSSCTCENGWFGTWCEWPLLRCNAAQRLRLTTQISNSARSSPPGELDPCSPGGVCDHERGRCECRSESIGLPSAPYGTSHVVLHWFGTACEQRECPNECSGHGVCRSEEEGTCSCDPGFASVDCSLASTISGNQVVATPTAKDESSARADMARRHEPPSADHTDLSIAKWIGIVPLQPSGVARNLETTVSPSASLHAWTGADLHPTSLERMSYTIARYIWPCPFLEQSGSVSLELLSGEEAAIADENGSGCLTSSEFVQASRTAAPGIIHEVLSSYATVLDVDHNGEIAPWEIAMARLRSIEEQSPGTTFPGIPQAARAAYSSAKRLRWLVRRSDNATKIAHVLEQASIWGRKALIHELDHSINDGNTSTMVQMLHDQREILQKSGPDASQQWLQTSMQQLVREQNVAVGQPGDDISVIALDGVAKSVGSAEWIFSPQNHRLGTTQNVHNAQEEGLLSMLSSIPISRQIATGDLAVLSHGPPFKVASMIGRLVSLEALQTAQFSLVYGAVFPLMKLNKLPASARKVDGELSFQVDSSGHVTAEVSMLGCSSLPVGSIVDLSGGAIVRRTKTSFSVVQPRVLPPYDSFAQVSWTQCTVDRPVVGLSQGTLASSLEELLDRIHHRKEAEFSAKGGIWITGVTAHVRSNHGASSAFSMLPFGIRLAAGGPQSNQSRSSPMLVYKGDTVIFDLVAHDSMGGWSSFNRDVSDAIDGFETTNDIFSRMSQVLKKEEGSFALPPSRLVRLAQSLLQVSDSLVLVAPCGLSIVGDVSTRTVQLIPVVANAPAQPSWTGTEELQFSGRIFRVGGSRTQLLGMRSIGRATQKVVAGTNSIVTTGSTCDVGTLDLRIHGPKSPQRNEASSFLHDTSGWRDSAEGSSLAPLDQMLVKTNFGAVTSVAIAMTPTRHGDDVCELVHQYRIPSITSTAPLVQDSINVLRPLAGVWSNVPGTWKIRQDLAGQLANMTWLAFDAEGAHLFLAEGDIVLVQNLDAGNANLATVTSVSTSLIGVSAPKALTSSGEAPTALPSHRKWGSGSTSYTSDQSENSPLISVLILRSSPWFGFESNTNIATDKRQPKPGFNGVFSYAKQAMLTWVAAKHVTVSLELYSGVQGSGGDEQMQSWFSRSPDPRQVVFGPAQLLPWETLHSLLGLSASKSGPSSVIGSTFADDVATLSSMTVSAIDRAASGSGADGRLTIKELASAIPGPQCLSNESPSVAASACALTAVYGLSPLSLYSASFWPTDRDNFAWCSQSPHSADTRGDGLSDCVLQGAMDTQISIADASVEAYASTNPRDAVIGQHKYRGTGSAQSPFAGHPTAFSRSRDQSRRFSGLERDGRVPQEGTSIGDISPDETDWEMLSDHSSQQSRQQPWSSTTMRGGGLSVSSSSSSSSSGGGGTAGGTDAPVFPPRQALQPFKEKPHDVMPGFFYFPSPFIWCPMFPPFLIPFCPTPIPQINILLKMMIMGVLRPPIDHILADFMEGVDATQSIFLCMFPMVDAGGARRGPPGLLQLGSQQRQQAGTTQLSKIKPSRHWGFGGAITNSLVQLDTTHLEQFEVTDTLKASTESQSSSGNHIGLVTPALKKQVATAVAAPIANDVASVVASTIHVQSHRPLVARLAGSVRADVIGGVTQDVISGAGRASAIAISAGISAASTRSSHVSSEDMKVSAPAVMVPVLSQAVVLGVVQGLEHKNRAANLEACAECNAIGSQGACSRCALGSTAASPRLISQHWAKLLSERLAESLSRAIARKFEGGEQN